MNSDSDISNATRMLSGFLVCVAIFAMMCVTWSIYLACCRLLKRTLASDLTREVEVEPIVAEGAVARPRPRRTRRTRQQRPRKHQAPPPSYDQLFGAAQEVR